MKNKDYVGRPAKKGKKANKQKQAESKPFPKLSLLLLLILLSGFGYGLWVLKFKSAPVDVPKPAAAEKVKKQKELPPLPDDEQWQFIEELENKQVTVDVDKVEDKGPFLMQCGSFRTTNQANTLKANIAFAGYESQVKATQGSSGKWYKVIMGPFAKKREAEIVRRTLKRNSINGCEIWLWR